MFTLAIIGNGPIDHINAEIRSNQSIVTEMNIDQK